MKVAHVITGLSTGGAETMLFKLLDKVDRAKFECRVYSLTDGGELAPRIAGLGIAVESVGMARGRLGLGGIFRLASRLRTFRPDVVHTWMYHADLIGGVAAKVAGISKVVWGVRNTNLDADKTSASTRLVVRFNARLATIIPSGILSCSRAACEAHIARGYPASRFHVIPNGFDLANFKPLPSARAAVRRELGIPEDSPVVGLVGRFDPLKNHLGFIDSAEMLRTICPDARFVLAGSGVDSSNARLVEAIRAKGLSERFHLLGRRDDMPRLMTSLDVLALASFGEAFPNVLGEAMACGVPCAVTDVGDSGYIIGDTGRVVSPGDTAGLARALGELLTLPAPERERLAAAARARVTRKFEIGAVARTYERYYESLLTREDQHAQ